MRISLGFAPFILLLVSFTGILGMLNSLDVLEEQEFSGPPFLVNLPDEILCKIFNILQDDVLFQANTGFELFCNKQDKLAQKWLKLLDDLCYQRTIDDYYFATPVDNLKLSTIEQQCTMHNVPCYEYQPVGRKRLSEFNDGKSTLRSTIFMPIIHGVAFIRQFFSLNAACKRFHGIISPLMAPYSNQLLPLKDFTFFMKRTLLCQAIQTDNPPLARLCVNMGTDINAQQDDEEFPRNARGTFLYNAVISNNEKSVTTLVALGAKISRENSCPSLLYAYRDERLGKLIEKTKQRELQNNNALTTMTTASQRILNLDLLIAIEKHDIAQIRAALENGADINAVEHVNYHGTKLVCNPLHAAINCHNYCHATVEFLLRQPEINVNLVLGCKGSPLHNALGDYNFELMGRLLRHPQIDINIPNVWGKDIFSCVMDMCILYKNGNQDVADKVRQVAINLLRNPMLDIFCSLNGNEDRHDEVVSAIFDPAQDNNITSIVDILVSSENDPCYENPVNDYLLTRYPIRIPLLIGGIVFLYGCWKYYKSRKVRAPKPFEADDAVLLQIDGTVS